MEQKIKVLKDIILTESRYFKYFDDQTLKEILRCMRKIKFSSKATILDKKQYVNHLFILSEGTVKIIMSESEEPVITEKLFVYGEEEVLFNHERSVIIEAETDCTVWLLSRSYVRACIRWANEKSKNIGFFEYLNDYSEDKTQKKGEYENIHLEDLVPVRTLGAGGFGSVDLVKYQKDPLKTFALKRVKYTNTAKLLRESGILLEVNNPFVVRCYKTFWSSTHVSFLLEACPGGNLDSVLRQCESLEEELVQFIIGCVVEALSYLHKKQIVHRDLKPANLVVDPLGFIKVTDFGLSKELDSKQRRTYTRCGTPNYIAPEVLLHKGHDRAADIWSLGIILYELLIGETPFDSKGDNYRIYEQILEGVMDLYYAPFEDLIRKLCHKEPTKRIGYRDMDEVRTHSWFDNFDWGGLQSMSITPPKLPLKSCDDSQESFRAETDCTVWLLSRSYVRACIRWANEKSKNMGFFEYLNDYSEDKTQKKGEYENIHLEDLVPVKTLGAGGFGSVDLVKYQKDPLKTFALKRVKYTNTAKLLRESGILLEVNNPFVVRCYKTFWSSTHVSFLLEACPGGNLDSVLRQCESLEEELVQFIIGCVVEALSYLHKKQIVHRDLKPANLVVDPLGFIKVTDFGLSKELDSKQRRTYTRCGTPNYIAPEVLLHKGHDRAADIWSLGIILYELLIGETPFDSKGDNYRIYEQILEGVMDLYYAPFEDLIRKLCHKEPTKRIGYRDMDEVRTHSWFDNFDWGGLQSMSITPPKLPLKSCDDSQASFRGV